MRKCDESKHSLQKATQSISFDVYTLRRLEEHAKRERTTVSKLVNLSVRNYIMDDVEFFRMMAKESYLEFQKYNYQKSQAEEAKLLQKV